jgi:hypothetical protein
MNIDDSSNSAVQRAIARLRKRRCQFPVSRSDLVGVASDGTACELARRGLVQNGELFDGVLPLGVACALENAGITTRVEFLRRYWAGEINPLRLQGVGPVKAKLIMAWADLPVSAYDSQAVPLDLTRATWATLDTLVQRRGLTGRAELITQLVAEELGRPQASPATRPSAPTS